MAGVSIVIGVAICLFGLLAAYASAEPGAHPSATALRRTGWNARARQQFMHPPVLGYAPVPGASRYRCQITWSGPQAGEERLESSTAEFNLASLWPKLPKAGQFGVLAEALDQNGRVLATASSTFQRIAPFEGPYRPAKSYYGESGTRAVAWLLEKKPTAYVTRYPAILLSSYIRLLAIPAPASAGSHVGAVPGGGQRVRRGVTQEQHAGRLGLWQYARVA